MYEKEIQDLQAGIAGIGKEIDDMENVKNAEKRDWTNAEIDVLNQKVEESTQKETLLRDYQNKQRIENGIAHNRALRSQPVNLIQSVPAGDIHKASTNIIDAAFRNWVRSKPGMSAATEIAYRDLSQGTDSAGGYLNAPANWSSQLIKGIDDAVLVRQFATVLPALTGSDTQGFPVYAGDVDDFDWTAEVPESDIASDTGMTYGKRELKPNMITKALPVSMKLLNISNFPVESFVNQRLQYKLSGTLEKGYMTGDGNGKPLGLFAVSANGIPASRDISDATLTYAGLCDLVDGVDQKYHKGCAFVFNQSVLSLLRGLEDDVKRPLFTNMANNNIAGGVPATLMGFPYIVSAFAPADTILFGDLKQYWVIDHAGFGLQRLDQIKALRNQIVYVARWMSDAAPVLAEAFARLTITSIT